jgi:large subunit ribosomal protein L30
MAKKKLSPQKKIRITLVRSPIGFSYRQKATVKALGLRKMHQTIEHDDNPALRGMIAKVSHLLEVEEEHV